MPDGGEGTSGQFDPVLFGKVLANTDTLINEFRDFKRDMSNNYVSRREHEELKGRVAILEATPEKNSSKKWAIVAVVFSGFSGLGATMAALVPLFKK